MQKLKLWWRITEENQYERIGPLIVSRLQGAPFTAAMSFTHVRDGVQYRGDEAIALPAQLANPPHQQEDQPGIKHFLNQQKAIYELHDQDRVGIVLDSFFDCRRGYHQDIPTWISSFELAFEDACEEGGLVMNDTGRSHFLLKNSGLSDKRLDDLKLHVA
eukprot:7202280-Pyramimonas_sp.AAC.1